MLFAKIVIFMTLIGGPCLSKIAIEVNKPDGFAEIEKAAIKLLTTCFGGREKTIVLLGEFPGRFVERLTSNLSLSVVLLDDRTRAENSHKDIFSIDHNRIHKVHVVVTMLSHYKRNLKMFGTIRKSQYRKFNSYYLIISYSKERTVVERFDIINILYTCNLNDVMNTNLMVNDRQKGVVLYTSNSFTNKAPHPWRLVLSIRPKNYRFHFWSLFVREYRENKDICENREFDRGHNIGGATIPVRLEYEVWRNVTYWGIKPRYDSKYIRKVILSLSKMIKPIVSFVRYMNGTPIYWTPRSIKPNFKGRSISAGVSMFRSAYQLSTASYPHSTVCQRIVTQSRGNKTQLKKIYDIIDGYSWIGMCIVYLITLIFFKFFMRLPLIAGLLNLLRLTCNFGLPWTPSSHSSRIYLGCLLFFVVTMQGIFQGNLASLLTHDIPVRQVNSFQDLVEFGYSLGILKRDSIYIDFPTYRGHLLIKFITDRKDCVTFVSNDSLNACLTPENGVMSHALDLGFHVSPCIADELICHRLPYYFYLVDEFNKFMRTQVESHTLLPFNLMVDEERFLELEAEEASAPLEPEVMTLEDLLFAFAILGCGLSCAIVAFLAELIIHWYQRRVWTERVTFLN